jgi:hypothetical protein
MGAHSPVVGPRDEHHHRAVPAMVDQLRAQPGGSDVPVTVGDFATVDVGTTFRLVYLVRNTITN